jgi:anti-sigma B factor antagonist
MRVGSAESGVNVLALEGEHDIYTAPKLRDKLVTLIDAGPSLIVDLSETTFVDSSILGALLNARQQAIEAETGFAVCVSPDADPAVRRIFEMTGLTDTLPVLETLELATEAASAGPPAHEHDLDP